MMQAVAARLRLPAAPRLDPHHGAAYLDRKRRELALINSCLSTPLDSIRPQSWAAAIDLKFRLAALLKADQILERWSVTETASPPGQWKRTGSFVFSFGYQRADLGVQGPPIYPLLERVCDGVHQATVYTGSGMAAIAALLTALLQSSDGIEVIAPADCYGETRELIRTFGRRIKMTSNPGIHARTSGYPAARLIWLDSSVRASYDHLLAATKCDIDLVVLDTTCYWRDSGKIGHVVRCALQAGLPTVLVRSHAKLDNLGIEYGRLGSLVMVAPTSARARRSRRIELLVPGMRDAVRLLGTAPTLANFPPFEQGRDYRRSSALRTASILRNTRGIARGLSSGWPDAKVRSFQHGLYLTIAIADGATMAENRVAAGELAMEFAAHGLPVRHGGSFGFDFVAIEAYSDPLDACSMLRICGGDIPLDLSEQIGSRIAAWCRRLRR